MRVAICSLILSAALCAPLAAQADGGRPRLLRYFDASGGDVLNGIYKLGLELGPTVKPGDAVAIRVCSADPMPVALAAAMGDPFQTALKLTQVGVPRASIYYLRQERDCPLVRDNYARTEYWFVPAEAGLPEFAEARRASAVSGYQLTRADRLLPDDVTDVGAQGLDKLTPQSYAAVLEKAAALLRDNKSAVVVIQVPYYSRMQTPELTRRVRETRAYLSGRQVAAHRVYVKRVFAGDRAVTPEDKLLYPDITVVAEN
ncbi:MAG TPA: hypothetical protein VF297_22930 [Pyrinomonadaceae bacterium]